MAGTRLRVRQTAGLTVEQVCPSFVDNKSYRHGSSGEVSTAVCGVKQPGSMPVIELGLWQLLGPNSSWLTNVTTTVKTDYACRSTWFVVCLRV